MLNLGLSGSLRERHWLGPGRSRSIAAASLTIIVFSAGAGGVHAPSAIAAVKPDSRPLRSCLDRAARVTLQEGTRAAAATVSVVVRWSCQSTQITGALTDDTASQVTVRINIPAPVRGGVIHYPPVTAAGGEDVKIDTPWIYVNRPGGAGTVTVSLVWSPTGTGPQVVKSKTVHRTACPAHGSCFS